MTTKKKLHSLDVALDHSVTLTAFAIGKDDKPLVKVHAFSYKNHDHYIVYAISPNGRDDTICGRTGLKQWLVDHGFAKTERGADGFLHKLIWEADCEHPILRDTKEIRDKELREQLGLAVYLANKATYGNEWTTVDWDNLPEKVREAYRKMGEAAVSAFLTPIHPTLQKVTENLLAIPALAPTLEPLVEKLEEYTGERFK